MKIGTIPIENPIDTDNIIWIKGIDNSIIPSIGTIELKFLNEIITFHVVPNHFYLPFDGILGSQYFSDNGAKINFKTNSLLVRDKKLKFKQRFSSKSRFTLGEITNWNPKLPLGVLPFIDIFNPPSNSTGRFMVDSGSEANIIKSNLLPLEIDIDKYKTILLKGVGQEFHTTIGTIEIAIFGKTTTFHVVPEDFDISCEGILGATYLTQTQAIIDYENKILQIDDVQATLKFNEIKSHEEKHFTGQYQITGTNQNMEPQSQIYGSQIIQVMNTDSTWSLEVNHLSENENEKNKNEKLLEPIRIKSDEDPLSSNVQKCSSIPWTQKEFIFGYSFKKTINDVIEILNIEPYTNWEIKRIYEIFHPQIPKDSKKYIFSINNQEINIENNPIIQRLRIDHLNESEKASIINLALTNMDRFLLNEQRLEAASTVMHRIITADDIPVNVKQYKIPISLTDELNKQVQEMLDSGIIKPSSSPYNSPLWIVPKKVDASGKKKWRIVSDFRLLNEKTISDGYPLPDITQIIDLVGGHKYYTTLDLAKGFQQILMDPRDSHKTAFSTPFGHYEYVRMTFGLKNAPPTFQRFIDETFKGLQGKLMFSFIDDIVVFADSIEEHEDKMKLIMERLKEANLQLNIDKCEFLRDKVCYLGHMLSKNGISPDPRKLEAVKDFPRPKGVKNVRQFLGLAGYYRRFIQNFAQIAKPLTKLLQKDVDFVWDDKSEQAFSTLKELLCNPPLLQYPDFSKAFNITTDASGYAIGGILSQGEIGRDRPIAYTSRVLRGPELKYEVYEKEAAAIVHSVRIFRSYIYGKKINIITDHQPLVWFKTADLNTRVQKWRFKLSEFDYDIIYKPGKLNLNADALSRNPVESDILLQCNVVTRLQKKLENLSCPTSVKTSNLDAIPQTDIIKKIDEGCQLSTKRYTRNPKPNYVESEDEDSINFEIRTISKHNKESFKLNSLDNESLEDTILMDQTESTENAPRKTSLRSTKSNHSSSNSSFSNQEPQILDPNLKCQIIETRDLIQVRRDNIVYFVSSNGSPCDVGAAKLIEFNKIETQQTLKHLEIKHTKRNKSNQFAVCIRGENPESISTVKDNLYTLLKHLKDLLIELKLNEISIARSDYIENLPWSDIVILLKIVFQDVPIKIIVCKGTLKYVPKEKRDEIFEELHLSPIGGHRGVSKTYNRIKQNYYWENLKEDIQRRIQQCLKCQLNKLVRLKTKQPMVITDTPGTVFDKLALDVVGPLPKTKNGHEYILTMQDQLSKYCIAVPLKDTLATTIADSFVKRFICTFGTPRVIITDQGQNFLSKLMTRVAKRFKIKKIRTTAFHPQSNGSLERSHHALGEFLKQYATVDQEWDEWIEVAMLNYNTCVSESTKHTPYEVVFGKLARLPSSDPLRETDLLPTYKGYLIDLVTRLSGIRTLVYDNLIDSKFRSKKYYDRRINPKNFKVGDYVFLLKGPKPKKFGNHYTGPHKILEIISKTNVRISMQKSSKVVHANRLRVSHINHEFKEKKRKRSISS